jgi:hypothetical protein
MYTETLSEPQESVQHANLFRAALQFVPGHPLNSQKKFEELARAINNLGNYTETERAGAAHAIADLHIRYHHQNFRVTIASRTYDPISALKELAQYDNPKVKDACSAALRRIDEFEDALPRITSASRK